MKRSLAEIEALLLKAARGAGVPLGHDAELASAGRYLAASSPVDLPQITLALRGPHVPVRIRVDGLTIDAARVAMAGPVAIDLMICGHATVILDQLDAPAVMQAMVAKACLRHGLRAVLVTQGDTWLLRSGEQGLLPAALGPVDINDADWQAWESFAAETYVPATEASRKAGAGAGLTDND